MPRAALASGALILALSSSVAAHLQPRAPQHVRALHHRRAVGTVSADEPTYLAQGSLSASAGCSSFYVTAEGDSCANILGAVAGLSEAALANANPTLDCSTALAAGVGYCVSGPSTELQFGSTDHVAVRQAAIGTV